jgi:hypothetical protein
MRLIAAALGVLALTVTWGGAPALAKGPFGSIKIGHWAGGAYTDDKTGAFSHCAAAAIAGPARLEFARVASGQGNAVVVYEREQAVGGHVRAYGALPYRQQFGSIATWLAEQARGNGSEIKLTSPVTRENIDAIIAFEKPDHVVVASGARYRGDGFQGQTGKPIAGWETGKCVSWGEVALDKVSLTSGEALVIDEMADVAAPLTAVKLAKQGVRTRLLTRWPMIGMETVAEVYFHWIHTLRDLQLFEALQEQRDLRCTHPA